MKNKKLENLLRAEADRIVPDGKEEIRARLGYRRAPVGDRAGNARTRGRFGWIAAPVAALLIAAVVLTLVFTLPGGGTGGGTPVPQPFHESVVRVDINPSVKFSVRKNGVVAAQTACNKDGAILLMNRDFVGREIGEATAEVVALAVKYGYLTDADGRSVNLKVLNDDGEIETELLSAIGSRVEAELVSLRFERVACNSAGKNDLVKYLVAYRGYAKKDAEKLSADELEDLLEDILEDEDDEELDGFAAELASGMTLFLTEITDRCRSVLTALRGIEADGEEYPLNAEARKLLKEYIRDFAFDAEVDPVKVLEQEEYEELLEDFEEELRDAEKSLRELKEEPEDGEDVSEDWYDRYKIYLKKPKNA